MKQIQFRYYFILLLCGAFWGITVPGAKYVMSTGYSETGMVFWEALLVCLTAGVVMLTGRIKIHLSKDHFILIGWVAFFGTMFPSFMSYLVIQEMPAGVFAIIIAMVPLCVMPIALLFGNERFDAKRMIGILIGAVAILVLIGPEASLPDRKAAVFVLIALVIPLSYALEDNFIAYKGDVGLHPSVILFVAMLFVTCLMGGISLARSEFFVLGQNGFGSVEWVVVGISVLHALSYMTFIWLIGKTGPIFTSLVAYLVTGFGVIWSMLLLRESYTLWVWIAFALMFVAMFLVRPRASATEH